MQYKCSKDINNGRYFEDFSLKKLKNKVKERESENEKISCLKD